MVLSARDKPSHRRRNGPSQLALTSRDDGSQGLITPDCKRGRIYRGISSSSFRILRVAAGVTIAQNGLVNDLAAGNTPPRTRPVVPAAACQIEEIHRIHEAMATTTTHAIIAAVKTASVLS